jgi:hypothetical protein
VGFAAMLHIDGRTHGIVNHIVGDIQIIDFKQVDGSIVGVVD